MPKHATDPDCSDTCLEMVVARTLWFMNFIGNAAMDEEPGSSWETILCVGAFSTTDNVHGFLPFNTRPAFAILVRDENTTSITSSLKTGPFGMCIGTATVCLETTCVAASTAIMLLSRLNNSG